MFQIEEELKKLPTGPGVYIMHDAGDRIIYVGKALNLKNRVRSYFRLNNKSPKIEKMVSLIKRFEYIITDSEVEALVLENNLIKEHNPKYNTMLKDGKTYPYMKVTIGEKFPRILYTREMKKDTAKYFGPFPAGVSVKDTIELMNKIFTLRTCNRNLPKDIGKERPCLNYHIGKCKGPCQGYITQEEYRDNVQRALEVLNGNYSSTVKDLEEKMNQASENMEFEEAITYRELIKSVKNLANKQKITSSNLEDKDIIALAMDEEDAVIQVFFVRDGKLIGREHFYMTRITDQTNEEILTEFIKQFYSGTPFIPKELMLQYEIAEKDLIEQWLTGTKGHRVHISVPQKGNKEKLVELAAQNARLVLSQDREKIKREEGRTIGAVAELATLLHLSKIHRMEAYDISNISGFANVGSMVVYEKGKPKRSDYRKFKIKSVVGPDDYACMKEVLTRRLLHGMEEKKQLHAKELESAFGSFTKFPDLILMDGGKGQVNIAIQVLNELQLSIPICGMVKDDNHRTRGLYFNGTEIEIDRNSEGFKLITRIQDEAHRFAIEYHRSLRSKSQVHSVLDEIPGIGPTRRKMLMRYFASIEELKQADVETISKVQGLSVGIAEQIHQFFHKTTN